MNVHLKEFSTLEDHNVLEGRVFIEMIEYKKIIRP